MTVGTMNSERPVGLDGLVTVQEVADFLRVCGATICNMVRRGDLPARRAGKRSLRIPRRALVGFASRVTWAGVLSLLTEGADPESGGQSFSPGAV